MLTSEEALRVMETAEPICSAMAVSEAITRVAGEISERLAGTHPLLLTVMNGGIFFAGQLAPQLAFPIELGYLHATRYGAATSGGTIEWRAPPSAAVEGRTVLVVDDVLDEGITLAAIRDRLLHEGAAACHLAVLVDKNLGRAKPVSADFVGLRLPNRYIFGCGMDVSGAWRNLPAIYALPE